MSLEYLLDFVEPAPCSANAVGKSEHVFSVSFSVLPRILRPSRFSLVPGKMRARLGDVVI